MHIADWKWTLILAVFYAAKYWWAWLIPLAAFIAWRWRKRAAPPAAPRVERYGDGVLVHWPEGVEQYVQVGDCVTGNLAVPPAALAVPAEAMLDALDEACKNSEGRRVSWYGYTQEQRIDVMRRAMLAAERKGE